MEGQRVVVIQDASREVNPNALRWALQGLSLKPGDMLTLLGVVRQVHTPSTFPDRNSRKFLGNKNIVDSDSMFGANPIVVDREVTRKKQEYESNAEIIQIFKLYETHKVKFKIEVAAGDSPKVVAVKGAESLMATWVILDRRMKKYRKYFLEKLSCGISRMKCRNRIKQLRGPKGTNRSVLPVDTMCNCDVTCDEMVPGLPEQEDLFSIELVPSQQKINQVSQVKEIAERCSKDETKDDWKAEENFQSSVCTICKNKRPSIGWKSDFTFSELVVATDSFSLTNCISEYGTTYAFRGRLSINLKILVKLYKIVSSQGEMNFNSEVHLLKKLRHKNVAMLLGSCTEGSVSLLVYEYACNGSVRQHLSKHCPLPLTWTERMKVALGVAQGLNYLHENNIIHRNLTTSNIVLTHDFEPMLGDVGLSIAQSDHSPEQNLCESAGYMAPEYAEKREFSTRTDVYSFGIVLLELISGQRATEWMSDGKSLVGWARSLLKERRHAEMVDTRIAKSCEGEQLYWMGRITQRCLTKNPMKRLTMDKVVYTLKYITYRRTFQTIEGISAVRSSLVHSRSDLSRFLPLEKRFERKSFSTDFDNNSQILSRSLSSLASNSTMTSTSFSKRITSKWKNDKMLRTNTENKVSVHYEEMLY